MSDYFKEREREMNMRLRQLREELPEFAEEFFVGIEPRTTVLTRLNYAYDLRIFFDYLCRRVRCCRDKQTQDITLSDLEKLTTANLESYLEYLGLYTFEGKEYSNGDRGKARKISTVRTFFKFFYNRDRLASDVAAKISLPKLRDKEIIRLEGREIERILEAAEEGTGMSAHQHKIQRGTRERDGAILSLLLGTGIRVSELVGLNVRDIDFESGAFTVTRKGGGRAILYFNDDVAEALTRYIEGERRRLAERAESKGGDEDALFLSMQARRMCVRAVENLVKKYRRAPEDHLPPQTQEHLRHQPLPRDRRYLHGGGCARAPRCQHHKKALRRHRDRQEKGSRQSRAPDSRRGRGLSRPPLSPLRTPLLAILLQKTNFI